jgi:hypothetical protein
VGSEALAEDQDLLSANDLEVGQARGWHVGEDDGSSSSSSRVPQRLARFKEPPQYESHQLCYLCYLC